MLCQQLTFQNAKKKKKKYSIFIWLAAFMAGTAGSLLVLSVFSYAHQFPSRCTTSVASGLAFSGIVVSVIGDIQRPGVADEMRFSFRWFMLTNGFVFFFFSLLFVFSKVQF